MLIIIGTAGSREKNIVSGITPAVNNSPTTTNTTFSARSRCIAPSSLLHAAHSPDIASLRAEAVEHDPSPVRRPDGVVDPHVRVGEFVDLLRLSSVDWRNPEYLVPYYIHDAGAIR